MALAFSYSEPGTSLASTYGLWVFTGSWVFPGNGAGGWQKPWVITGYGLSQRGVMTESTVLLALLCIST